MKIAFLILAHHHPRQLSALVQALDDDRFDFFVHVDERVDFRSFTAQEYPLRHSTLRFLSRRKTVFWGDISMVDAMLELFREAMAQDGYERFVVLSGEDYPIESNDAIYARLSRPGIEFINGTRLRNNVQVEGFWFWKLSNKLLVRCIRKLLYMAGIRKKPYLMIENRKWDVYHGSQWIALSRECAQYVLSVAEANPQIRSYFRFSHAPDQLFIPTIVYNSADFREKTCCDRNRTYTFNEKPAVHYLRYHPQPGSSVDYLDESDYEALLASQKLFLRKVCIGKSDKLIEMLDGHRNRQI